nr:MAG TPA: YjcQ protein [Caudoviricetes sp.]
MEDFRIIYRILKLLQQSMDFEDFDSEGFNAGRFGTNPNRFQALLIQLQRAGYIEGLDIVQYIRQPEHIEPPMHPKITLKGLEYLQENSMMKQAAAFAKGIKEIVPGI